MLSLSAKTSHDEKKIILHIWNYILHSWNCTIYKPWEFGSIYKNNRKTKQQPKAQVFVMSKSLGLRLRVYTQIAPNCCVIWCQYLSPYFSIYQTFDKHIVKVNYFISIMCFQLKQWFLDDSLNLYFIISIKKVFCKKWMKTSVATMIIGDLGPSILSSTEVNGNI